MDDYVGLAAQRLKIEADKARYEMKLAEHERLRVGLLNSLAQSKEIAAASVLNNLYDVPKPRIMLPRPSPVWLSAYNDALIEANERKWVVGL